MRTHAKRRLLVGLALACAVVFVVAAPFMARGFISTGPAAERTWFWQNPLPQGNDLRGQSWLDADRGWIVGVSGTVLKTTDGGKSWQVQDALSPLSTRDLTGVSFVNASTGWVVGVSATVLRTDDGGATWKSQTATTVPAARNFRAVSFYDSSVGVAVGDQGTTTSTVQYTANGGVTWRAATIPTTCTAGLSSVKMVSASTGWAVGAAGCVLKTTDGGANWTQLPAMTVAGLTSVSFEPSGNVGYVVGNVDGASWVVYKTTDAGATWTATPPSGSAANLTGVSCFDANNAVVVGASGLIRRTRDGGASWVDQGQGTIGSLYLRGVQMVDPEVIRTIGDVGLFFSTSDGGASWFSAAQGNSQTLRSIWFVDADHGWVCGDRGTIMASSDAGASWASQAVGVGVWRSVHFVDQHNGWAVGDSGAIVHTTDGVNWRTQNSGTTQQLAGVWFVNSSLGFTVGTGGTILKTTDGGQNWVPKTVTPSPGTLCAVWFADAMTGYAVNTSSYIFKTTDGGETWTRKLSGAGQILNSVRGTDANNVWIGGNNGTLVKTTDGGANWTLVASGAGAQPIRTVAFSDANTGWFGSSYGLVKRTTDGGSTWTTQSAGMPTDVSGGFYSLCVLDSDTGYLAGDTGVLRRTLNGGANWTSIQYGTLSTLNGLVFADSANAWACGSGGAMLHTSDAGQSWAVQKTGTNSGLAGLWMSSSGSGWTVGDNGTVRRTADGGQLWTAQNANTTANLKSVSSGDTSTAILVGPGVVRYTTDAGATWQTGSAPTTLSINSVSMTDASNAWCVGPRLAGANVVWHTSDGGSTWGSQATTANANLWTIKMLDGSTGFAGGDSGVILKTGNGGTTWVRRPTPTTLPIYAIDFADANRGYASGGGGILLRTVNGGATWTLVSAGAGKSLAGVAFSDASRAYIVGGNGLVLRSGDLTPPSTSLSVTPSSPNGQAGWYVSTPRLSLSANRPSMTYFGWTSSGGPFSMYTGPVDAPQGAKSFYYYSVDASANAETVAMASIKTDITSPTPPASVSVSGVTTSSATVAWSGASDAISGVGGYQVLLDGAVAATTTATTHSFSGLADIRTYHASIRTVDVAGNVSPASVGATFTTDELDRAPVITSASVAPASPDGADGWYVNAPVVSLASSPATVSATTHYSFDAVPSLWTTYTGGVTAPVGSSVLSFFSTDNASIRATETVRTLALKYDPQTPSVPADLGALAVTAETIHLSWTPVASTPSGVAGYDIYEGGVLLARTPNPFYDAAGLNPETTYSFSIAAVNGAGTTSARSASVNATTPATALPQAPASLYAAAPTGDHVFLNWWPVSTEGAGSYRIWRSEDGVTYSQLTTVAVGVTSYTDAGLRSSTRYYYAVSAVDSRGEGPRSATTSSALQWTAPITGRPQRPAGLSAVEGSASVALNWQPVSNAAVTGYLVTRADKSLGVITTLTVAPTVSASWVDTSVANGSPYWYSVSAIDESGTIGFPSLEERARPRQGYSGPDIHIMGSVTGAAVCESCHTIKWAPTDSNLILAKGGPNEVNTCMWCHSSGSGLASTETSDEVGDPLAVSGMSVWTSATPTVDATCMTCHKNVVLSGKAPQGLLRVNGVSTGQQVCYQCHGASTTLPYGDMTGFEGSGHSKVPLPASGSEIACSTCHESHRSRNEGMTKYAGYMQCMQCHTSSASNPDEPDLWSGLTASEDSDSRHPLLPQDQLTGARMQCQNCHNTHATNSANPLVDPHDPSPQGTWTVSRTDEKAFCFRCHDGEPLPTAAETAPWAGAVAARSNAATVTNLSSAYNTNVHGFNSASGATTTTAHLRADMGYAYAAVLECRACHDPHGGANNFALRQTVTSADGGKSVTGLLVTKIPAGSVTTTSPVGYDLRFFCASCHVWDPVDHDARVGSSTSSFPTDCVRCHRHVRTNGTASTRL